MQWLLSASVSRVLGLDPLVSRLPAPGARLTPPTTFPSMPRTLLTLPPDAGEYAPFYAGYVARVPAGDILTILDAQLGDTLAVLAGFGEARGDHRYEPDKWSVKEIVGHLADTERIFNYRALRIARGDTTPLSGFDQDVFVAAGRFGARTLESLTRELELVRHSTVALFTGFDDTALARRGTANNVELTPRAAAHIIAGHERHHLAVLRERYL